MINNKKIKNNTREQKKNEAENEAENEAGNENENEKIIDNNELVEQDKDLEINDTEKKPFNLEFFLLLGFVIMLGIDIYNTRIDYFNLPIKKIMNGGYTDEFGVGGIKGVRSEFFGPNISRTVQIKYTMFIILFFLLVVSISLPISLLIVLIVICYIFGKKNVLRLINSLNTEKSK